MKTLNYRVPAVVVVLVALLSACAPAVAPAGQVPPSGGPQFAAALSPAEVAATDTATAIFYRMELGRLQTGSYTSNVLIELTDLPAGIAFVMESFPGESFEIRVTDDALPGIWWLVDPTGVTRHDMRG